MAKARKYKKVSCHDKKADAKKVQKRLHDKGQTATIVKGKDNKYCVKTAGAKKR